MPGPELNKTVTPKLFFVLFPIVCALGGYAYGLSKGIKSVENAFDDGITTAMTNAKVRIAASSADVTVAATDFMGRLLTKFDQPVIDGNIATVTATLQGQQCQLTLERHDVSGHNAQAEWKVTKHSCASASGL